MMFSVYSTGKFYLHAWKRLAGLVLGLIVAQLAVAAETLRIGVEDDWYPYSGVVDGTAAGFGVDLTRAAFAASGYTVDLIAMPYKRCMEMTKAGRLVACVQPTRLPENEADFLWPEKPLFAARSLIYARAPTDTAGLTVESLRGRHVAMTNGFDYGGGFESDPEIRREMLRKEILVFRMLVLGRVEFGVAYEKTANHLLHSNADEFDGKLTVVGKIADNLQYCAFSKSHPRAQHYLKAFNTGFNLIINNGTYREIEKRWH